MSNLINIYNLIPAKEWALVAYDEGMMFYEKVSDPRTVHPPDANLLSTDEYRKLPAYVKPAVKSMTNYISDFQNRNSIRKKTEEKKDNTNTRLPD